MRTTIPPGGDDAVLSPEAAGADREMEIVLDRMVSVEEDESLPGEGFGRRLSLARPFATWEVRLATHWRFPAVAACGLTVVSAAVGLAPVWRLGPAAASTLWFDLLGSTLVRPVAVLFDALPLLLEAATALRRGDGLFPLPGLLLGTAAVGVTTWLLARSRRPASDAMR